MFIGRKKEYQEIVDRINSPYKELVAIIGKRGVGKTTLMSKVQNELNEKTLYLFGRKGVSNKQQLETASRKLNEYFDLQEKCHSWEYFFNILIQESKKTEDKIIICIDEFPWLNVKGSLFVEDFGNFWNILNSNNIKVIITGSAVSWLNKNVFRNKGGLYHKTTCKIYLKSFNLLETAQYLRIENPHFRSTDIIEYYLLTGGVVRYLQQIRGNRSIDENREFLFNETYFEDFFDNSFNSTKTNIHKQVIELFKDRIRLSFNEIASKFSYSQKLIYDTLNELEETDVIKSFKNKNQKEYVITDLYCFYHLRKHNFTKHKQRIIDGYSLEILTILNIDLILQHIGRNGFSYSVQKWQNPKAQIDLLVNYNNNQLYSIVECKNYNSVYELDIDEKNKLLNRMDEFYNSLKSKKSEIDLILVSPFGSKNRTSLRYIDVSLNSILQ